MVRLERRLPFKRSSVKRHPICLPILAIQRRLYLLLNGWVNGSNGHASCLLRFNILYVGLLVERSANYNKANISKPSHTYTKIL